MNREPILRGPIGFLLLPQFTLISLSSEIEPLRIANRYVRRAYEWKLLSVDGLPVPDGNGLVIAADAGMDGAGALGTLLVCCGIRPERFQSAVLTHWLQELDRGGTTLGGIASGCFLLAGAGLLDGRRATLHWELIDAFRQRFPKVELRPTLFEIDERRLSCAGGTAVIDLMLAAIAADHGFAMAERVAGHCLHERMRAGRDWQRMALPLRSGAHHPTLVKALRMLDEQPESPPRMADLAREVGVSSRHLLRLFRTYLRESPGRYELRQRLERARALLERGGMNVTQVAEACGFQSPAHFARAFRRQFGTSPSTAREARTMPRLLSLEVEGNASRDG